MDAFDCLKANGGDVRLYTYQFGHVWPSGPDMITATPFSGSGQADASEIEIGLEEDVEPQEDEGPLSEEDQER